MFKCLGESSTPGIQSVFHRILPIYKGFYSRETFILAHNALCNITETWKSNSENNIYLLNLMHLYYKVEHLAHSFPVRIEFVLKGVLPAT
jgi:hypothetical protein